MSQAAVRTAPRFAPPAAAGLGLDWLRASPGAFARSGFGRPRGCAMTGFATTRWSLILDAKTGPEAGRVALEQICRDYRQPVLSFVKRHGYASADAEDLTQDFFARLLEQGWHARADPSLGRFRSYLLTALRRFLSDARDSAGAQKRGGGQLRVSTDETLATLAAPGSESPEQAFTKHWMKTVVARAMHRLRAEALAAGKQELYEQLNGFLGETPDPSAYRELGERLGMRPNTIAVGVHRMRQRLRALVREELLQTVADATALDEELRELRATFSDDFNGT